LAEEWACFPIHALKAAHEWGTRAFVARRGEAGSLREWKERKASAKAKAKAKAEAKAKADSSALLRNDKIYGKTKSMCG
jgi:hypothetical protein